MRAITFLAMPAVGLGLGIATGALAGRNVPDESTNEFRDTTLMWSPVAVGGLAGIGALPPVQESRAWSATRGAVTGAALIGGMMIGHQLWRMRD